MLIFLLVSKDFVTYEIEETCYHSGTATFTSHGSHVAPQRFDNNMLIVWLWLISYTNVFFICQV
jgi:hypothetical protein